MTTQPLPPKPPMITRSESSLKGTLPSWVWPTLSALAMLILCLIGFLGYLLLERHAKPEERPVVAQKVEREPIVEPASVKEEDEEVRKLEVVEPVEAVLEIPEPGKVVEDVPQPIAMPMENKPEAVVPEPPAAPLPKEVQPEVTPEPVEATEARQRYDDAVEQAIQPYREELEKESALAKKNGNLDLVLAFEAELKHLASENCTEITPFKPEKRSLFNVKVRCKKQLETASESYRKKLDALVKELVRTERIDEAKIVREMLEHLEKPTRAVSAIMRKARPSLPTLRLSLEILADGKGRFVVERGKTTDPPFDNFPGTPFPFASFPKARTFRGENGMGRILFDFADANLIDDWKGKSWFFLKDVIYRPGNGVMGMEPKKEPIVMVTHGLKRFAFPIRINGEYVFGTEEGSCGLQLNLVHETTRSCFFHARFHPKGAEDIDCYGYYSLEQPHKPINLFSERFQGRAVFTFQMPMESALKAVDMIRFEMHNLENTRSGLSMIDVMGKLPASAGFDIDHEADGTAVKTVDDLSSAFLSGLKPGDEIVRFNGTKRTGEQIGKILDNVRFGDLLTVAVLREGEERVFRFHAE